MSESTRIHTEKNRANKEGAVNGKLKSGFSQQFSPDSLEGRILHLQRTIGNSAVTRLIQSGVIQAKLKIGQSNDIYEQEADRVAEQVMRMAESKQSLVQQKPIGTVQQKGGVNVPELQCQALGFNPPRVCVCVFKANVGKLEIDSSCVGSLALWVIPESAGNPAFTPATAGTGYWADGFKIGSQIYKIDGSTCVTLSCSGGSVQANTCVNTIALLMGKRAPYPVPSGTFANEPPPGTPAAPVI